MSNLPLRNISKKTDEDIKVFFDRYFTKEINFSDERISTTITFFENKGFQKSSAIAIAMTLLSQAKQDNVDIAQLLDTLKQYDYTKLNYLVAEILNYNRKSTSAIGFKRENNYNKLETRNIITDAPVAVIINTSTENNFSSTGFTFDLESLTWDGE